MTQFPIRFNLILLFFGRWIPILAIFIFDIQVSLQAQNLSIFGSILDENDKILPGVQIDLYKANSIIAKDK